METDGRQYQAINRAALTECEARLEARDREIDERRAECERLRERERRLYDALWTLDGHARLYMTLAQNVDEQTREALATPPPEGGSESWAGTWDEQADVPLCDWKPGMRNTPDQSSTMDHGGVGQVGCEGGDGLLRVHAEDESCDVCAPQQAHGDALAALEEISNACDYPPPFKKWAEPYLNTIRRHLTASGVPYVPEEVRQIPYEMRMNARQTEGGLVAQRLLELWSDKLETALASAPADGCKLVPVEPTAAMKEAGQGCNLLVGDDPMGDAYRAMIAAAPTDGRE